MLGGFHLRGKIVRNKFNCKVKKDFIFSMTFTESNQIKSLLHRTISVCRGNPDPTTFIVNIYRGHVSKRITTKTLFPSGRKIGALFNVF